MNVIQFCVCLKSCFIFNSWTKFTSGFALVTYIVLFV
jgi:hypothetical protein